MSKLWIAVFIGLLIGLCAPLALPTADAGGGIGGTGHPALFGGGIGGTGEVPSGNYLMVPMDGTGSMFVVEFTNFADMSDDEYWDWFWDH